MTNDYAFYTEVQFLDKFYLSIEVWDRTGHIDSLGWIIREQGLCTVCNVKIFDGIQSRYFQTMPSLTSNYHI
jgi:hypothetical protein